MSFQTVFKRYELKYLITLEQRRYMLDVMSQYMEPDQYGRSTVRNVYFDTEDYRLIRRSLEKPIYKEKLRMRSYSDATPDSTVFVELKKKYKGVVYKRRLTMREGDAMGWLCGGTECHVSSQISGEIDYFLSCYGKLMPRVFLSYEREAFYENGGGDLRITFDSDILARQTELSLTQPPDGKGIIDDGQVLMEIKCSGGIPLWLTSALSAERLYKTSFSKYGRVYCQHIFPAATETNTYNTKEITIHA